MSGRAPRQVRPVLLLVVYGVFLVVVGVTATVQTALVSLHFTTAAINTAVAGDAAIVRAFVNDGLAASDLTAAADPARVERLNGLLAALAGNAGLRRLEIRDQSGSVRLTSAADAPADPAIAEPDAPTFAAAAGGLAQAGIVDTPAGDGSQVMRALFPLLDEAGETRAIVGVWRDAGPILAPIADVQRDMLVVTLDRGHRRRRRSCTSSSDPRRAAQPPDEELRRGDRARSADRAAQPRRTRRPARDRDRACPRRRHADRRSP